MRVVAAPTKGVATTKVTEATEVNIEVTTAIMDLMATTEVTAATTGLPATTGGLGSVMEGR
jgi:hypothetical protein